MALTQKLQLRQSHARVMTPQLMQAIKLLQLSNLDLVGYVESELERNPLLERTGESEGEAEPQLPDQEATAADERPQADWTEGSFATGGDVVAERPDGEVNGADDAEAVVPRASSDPAGYTEWN